MAKIIVLSDSVCNQIAAGEVVERPAAVVKELAENSIDAQSRTIRVSLAQGGRREIRVVDSGEGMGQEDALLALERHATSKIRAIEDLETIRSLGFRGEALPSIAAVSRFELITRERDAVSGTHIRIEGGVLKDVREVGCQAGTAITVRDIFFNIPARRKFLRSIETEMSHISDQFIRLAMAHPEIHMQLSHEERLHHDFPVANSPVERAAQILGREMAELLHQFQEEVTAISIRGLMSPPELHRSNSHALFTYVNGRSIQDRGLNRSILTAYDTLLPRGKYPAVALFIEISPELVDVNTHPAKREVRFRSPNRVFDAITGTIKAVLDKIQKKHWEINLPAMHGTGGSAPDEPEAREPRGTPLTVEYEQLAAPPPPAATPFLQTNAFPEPPPRPTPAFVPGEPVSAGEEPGPLFSRLPILGQLGNTYILLESPDGLVLIDQHAAHERVVFDLMASAPGAKSSQRLLQPVVVDCLPKEAAALRRLMLPLAELGFQAESFGGDSFIIHAVPASLSHVPAAALLKELAEADHDMRNLPQTGLMAALAKTAACHSAIRAGQKLQRDEIVQLLKSLDQTRSSAACPHGRPLWWKLTYKDLARFFNRS